MGLVVGLVNCDSEFGHGLQWMLTQTDNGLVAGINNVEWDAVELPSQFMENWLYSTYEVVESLSQHVETSEPLPKEIWQKIVSKPPDKTIGCVSSSRLKKTIN
jgi:Zn-dependent oligopeptidase